MDSETPVSDDYKARDKRLIGTIHKIVLEVGPLQLGASDPAKIRQFRTERIAAE